MINHKSLRQYCIRYCHCAYRHLNRCWRILHRLVHTHCPVWLIVQRVTEWSIRSTHHSRIHAQKQECTSIDRCVIYHHEHFIWQIVRHPLCHWHNCVHCIALLHIKKSIPLILSQTRRNHWQWKSYNNRSSSLVTEINRNSRKLNQVSVIDCLTQVSIQSESRNAWSTNTEAWASIARRLTGLTVIVGIFKVSIRATCRYALTIGERKSWNTC